MFDRLALAALAFGAGAYGQQAGSLTAENHPSMPWQQCTTSGCTSQKGSVVLDANWRWVHSTSGSTNCYTGNKFDATLCPNNAACAKNCALEGADYSGTYGISSSGGSLTLQLVKGSNVGSRTYLMAPDDTNYQMFKLKNREFTFDVDVSQLPCGLNGALYFVSMDADGGKTKYSTNTAGAKFGTGYCDSQCPRDLKFINGLGNSEGWGGSTGNSNSGTGAHGTCCDEMDIWEANSISTALTPHVCNKVGQTMCTSDVECGSGSNRYAGTCDKDGCDFNPYRQGNTSYYGPNKLVNTNQKMTVVTKFITSNGQDSGTLSAIQRLYVQNGKIIQQSQSNIAGIDKTNQITTNYCTQQKSVFGDTNSFQSRGGMKAMSDSFDRGMVLVMSIWDDYEAQMLWLDAPYPATADPKKPGVSRGTCANDSGNPKVVESQSPNSKVTFSNIKFGALGSTYKAS